MGAVAKEVILWTDPDAADSKFSPLTEKGEFILLSQLTSIPDLLRSSATKACLAVGFIGKAGAKGVLCVVRVLLVELGRGSSARKARDRFATKGEKNKKTNIPAKKGRLFFMKPLFIKTKVQYQKYHCLFYEFISAFRMVKAG